MRGNQFMSVYVYAWISELLTANIQVLDTFSTGLKESVVWKGLEIKKPPE